MGNDLAKHAFWKKLVDEYCASGLSMRKWCQENNIVYQTFQYWKEKILKDQLNGHQEASITKKNFTELVDRPQSDPSEIEIVISKTSIRLRKGFDEETLRSCLCALGG